jgi:hypothetical protein
MGASVAGRRTRILVMTGEVELMRLVRSVLEPSGCLVSSDGLSGAGAKADGPFDIVVLDLPGRDLDQLRHAKRAHPVEPKPETADRAARSRQRRPRVTLEEMILWSYEKEPYDAETQRRHEHFARRCQRSRLCKLIERSWAPERGSPERPPRGDGRP